MLSLRKFKSFIFDLDGTLLRSNVLHAKAWQEALHKHGYEISLKTIRSLIGMGGDKITPRVTGWSENSSVGKRIARTRAKVYKSKYADKAKAFPHVRSLMEQLSQSGRKVGIASSASADDLRHALDLLKISDLIDFKICGDDVKYSKPDPDIVSAAIRASKVSRAKSIFFGDTPYDIEAAARAGIRCVAFRSGGWSDQDLTGAEAIFEDVGELYKKLDIKHV